jgi:uncharacterized protein YceK
MKRLVFILCVGLLSSCSSIMTSAQGKHVAAGFMVGGAVYVATDSPFLSCMASFAAGAAKETYDATGRGNVSGSDVLYAALPSCAIFYGIDFYRQVKNERSKR